LTNWQRGESALSVAVRILGPDRLDLHQHAIFHQKGGGVSTDRDTVVFNSDGDLLPDNEPDFVKSCAWAFS
jgi:hypothetical protein